MKKLATATTTEATNGRNWREDKEKRYVAHFNPETGVFDGPADAFVWLGLPYLGNPYRNTRTDEFTNERFRCATYLEESATINVMGDVPVKFVAWDELTGCQVYERVSA